MYVYFYGLTKRGEINLGIHITQKSKDKKRKTKSKNKGIVEYY